VQAKLNLIFFTRLILSLYPWLGEHLLVTFCLTSTKTIVHIQCWIHDLFLSLGVFQKSHQTFWFFLTLKDIRYSFALWISIFLELWIVSCTLYMCNEFHPFLSHGCAHLFWTFPEYYVLIFYMCIFCVKSFIAFYFMKIIHERP